MNRIFSVFERRTFRWHGPGPIIVILLGLLGAANSAVAQTPLTNQSARFPTLQEVRTRWGSVPLEEVRQAAERGELTAEHYLGYAYSAGERVPRDAAQAIAWYEKAGNGGYLPSVSNLGLLYSSGEILPPDAEMAMAYYRRAAEGGFAPAQVQLAFRYQNMETFKQTEAATWYRRAAEQGNADGQLRLARCLLAGAGVEQNEETGLEWMRRAADQDQLDATVELADLYARGIGEPRDARDRPIELLLRAGRRDFEPAYQPLVNRYWAGVGTRRDLVASGQWHMRTATFKRQLSALGRNAYSYAANQTGQNDPFRAVLSLLLQAARPEEVTAPTKIAEMYLTGKDVPQSPAKAWLWCSLAGQRGSTEARAKLKAIKAQLSADELKEAKAALPGLVQELNRVAAALPMAEATPRR